MAYRDLRDYLTALEKRGKLKRVMKSIRIGRSQPSAANCSKKSRHSNGRHLSSRTSKASTYRRRGSPRRDLRLKEAGGSGAYLVISLKKQFDGQVRQLMYGAWSMRTGFGKITVVVDEDIDIWDDFAVDWALSWHVRPEGDIYIETDVQAVGLDPSQAPASVRSIIRAEITAPGWLSMRPESTPIPPFPYRQRIILKLSPGNGKNMGSTTKKPAA